MSHPLRPINPAQRDRYRSPWPLRTRLARAAWALVGAVLFRLMPVNRVRVAILRLYGAKVASSAYVDRTARIWAPWNLAMKHRACVGAEVRLYNLALITLGRACTVAQESYLCTGSHDFDSRALTLLVAPIEVGTEAFLGARCFVLPGRTIGKHAVVGAGSVVTHDVPDFTVVAGNPARFVPRRS